VLEEIGCQDKDMLILLNKCDAIKNISDLETLQTLHPTSITVSAKTGLNLEKVASAIAEKINGAKQEIIITCSAANGKLQSFLRKHGEITDEKYENNDVEIRVRIGTNLISVIRNLKPQNIEVTKSKR
jgi:50S ribosomal subunit-associated GTPase HflX